METFIADTWQRQAMVAFLLVGLAIYVVADIVASFTPGATISEIALGYFTKNPSLAFLMGCVLGHIFWPQLFIRPGWQTVLVVGFALAFCIVAFVVEAGRPMMPILPMCLGVVFGHYLWPQRTATGIAEVRPYSQVQQPPEPSIGTGGSGA